MRGVIDLPTRPRGNIEPKAAELIVPGILKRHAQELSARWRRRATVVGSSSINLEQMLREDRQTAAHADGLAVAGDLAWPMLERCLSSDAPADLFARTVMIGLTCDEARWTTHLPHLFTSGDRLAAGAAAFDWMPGHHAAPLLLHAFEHPSAHGRMLALAAAARVRLDLGHQLQATMHSTDAQIRAAALTYAGAMGRRADLAVLLAALGDSDPACALAAAKAAFRLGEREYSPGLLRSVALGASVQAEDALVLLAAGLPLTASRALMRDALSAHGLSPGLFRAIAASADAHYLDWLHARAAEAPWHRLALFALAVIGGLDPWADELAAEGDAFADWRHDVQTRSPAALTADERDMPAVHIPALAQWFESRRQCVNGDVDHAPARTLCGLLLDHEGLFDTLLHGCQRDRAVAARHLALLAVDLPMLDVSTPAMAQLPWLAEAERALTGLPDDEGDLHEE